MAVQSARAPIRRGPSAGRGLVADAPGVTSRLAISVASGVVGAAIVVAAAWLFAVGLARVVVDHQDLLAVTGLLIAMAGLAGVRWVSLVAGDVLAQRAAGRLRAHLRERLTAHLLLLGPAYAAREQTGELSSVTVQGLDALDTYVSVFLPARWLAVAVPILIVVVVAAIDPPTVLVLFFTGPILVLLLAVIGARTGAITERRRVEVGWLSAFFLDMLQGIGTLKAFGRSAEQADAVGEMSRRYGETTLEVLRSAFRTSLVLEWGAALAMALVAVEVSIRLIGGSMTFERALAVLVITPEFFLPLRRLATSYHAGAAGEAAAGRIRGILAESPRPTATVETPAVALAPATICFEAVTVQYPGRSVAALDTCSFEIPPRGLVTLTGPTGSGKSTVVATLLRFIDPDAGAITVGDRSLAAIDPTAWRAELSWVPQAPWIFAGSVADNLRLGRPEATLDELRAAATAADIDAFIESLPQGYDTLVGERGLRLSGGERQRLAIARAFVRPASLLILDEPTSNLDGRSQAAVVDSLRRLATERSVLVVSHRQPVIDVADAVIRLEHGRVVAP